MKAFTFHIDTKEFLAETTAQPSPLDKGEYILPANSTHRVPITHKTGYARCFINNEWVYLVDNRNTTKYIGSDKVNFSLGDKVTAEMTDQVNENLSMTEVIARLRLEASKKISFIYRQNGFNSPESGRTWAKEDTSLLREKATKLVQWELALVNKLLTVEANILSGEINYTTVKLETYWVDLQ